MRYLLIDQITEVQHHTLIRGIKNIAMSEDFLSFHFPDNPVMPGALLIEALVQLAGWLEAQSSGFNSWVLLSSVGRCRYYGFARPGDQVSLEVTSLPSTDSNVRGYKGIGSGNGKKLIHAEFKGILYPLSTLHDPVSARHFFQILTRDRGVDPNG
ncbi:MAG: beta-hydroxyacyl-ACP dehydratase [Deltaproteobacteria bacterium]|nr:beta-hydroxyacyl-ACP dehydratase [Deltaproteobacteria bacterium]